MVRHILPSGPRFVDLTGRPFHRLTAREYVGKRNGSFLWRCDCQCGRSATVLAYSLVSGGTKSCGCLKIETDAARYYKHGGKGTPEYGVWKKMRARCNNPNHDKYAYYGGRGIKVCERWDDFANFLADVGPRPTRQHSIDRREVDGDYCPENCAWATKKEQMNNTRRNVFLEYEGERRTVAEWSDLLGVSRLMIYSRISYGWPTDLALTLPPHARPEGVPRTEQFRQQGRAHYAVRKAVAEGRLVRPARCTVEGCASRHKPQAHHHNGYAESHRLDVIWLCPKHHNAETFAPPV